MLHLLSRYYNNSWITVSVRGIENQTPFVMIILQKLLGGLYSLCKTNASQLSRCHKNNRSMVGLFLRKSCNFCCQDFITTAGVKTMLLL